MRSKPLQVVLVARGIVVNNEGKILIVRRVLYDSCNPGLWEFPGGKVEKGEGIWAARKREIEQETGLVVGGIVLVSYADDKSISDGEYKGVHVVRIFGVVTVTDGKL